MARSLSVGGGFAFGGLFECSLSMPSPNRLLVLLGVVNKNAILLADCAGMARRGRAMPRTEAILTGCGTRACPS